MDDTAAISRATARALLNIPGDTFLMDHATVVYNDPVEMDEQGDRVVYVVLSETLDGRSRIARFTFSAISVHGEGDVKRAGDAGEA